MLGLLDQGLLDWDFTVPSRAEALLLLSPSPACPALRHECLDVADGICVLQ